MREWRQAWWRKALDTGDTPVSRMVRWVASGNLRAAFAIADALGVGDDVGAWADLRVADPKPYLPPPRVGRWVICEVCGGSGAVIPPWAGYAMYGPTPEPPENFSEDCPECGGAGGWLDPYCGYCPEGAWGSEDTYREWRTNRLAAWVAAYREARRNGASPEEARFEADRAEWREDFDPDAPLPF